MEPGVLFFFALAVGVLLFVGALHQGRARRRRRGSLRRERGPDGAEVFVWIELDGSERRSTRDPRPDWDSAEGGADGDGGGGD
jgi:hypothetical protein